MASKQNRQVGSDIGDEMNYRYESGTKAFEATALEIKDYLHPISFRIFAINFERLLRDRGFYFEFTVLNFIILELSFTNCED